MEFTFQPARVLQVLQVLQVLHYGTFVLTFIATKPKEIRYTTYMHVYQ